MIAHRATRAFSRAAGAPLISGNSVRLLTDAGENYPAWLDAIGAAKRHVLDALIEAPRYREAHALLIDLTTEAKP